MFKIATYETCCIAQSPYLVSNLTTLHELKPRYATVICQCTSMWKTKIKQNYAVRLHLLLLRCINMDCSEVTASSKNIFNRLTPNDPYMGRTAPLTSIRCILYIYSTNIGTEYFKHVLYSPFFSLQNAAYFIMLTCLFPVLFTFYIQVVLKLKKKILAPKG